MKKNQQPDPQITDGDHLEIWKKLTEIETNVAWVMRLMIPLVVAFALTGAKVWAG